MLTRTLPFPARYALERRQWSEAAKLTLAEEEWKDFPWQRFPWATSHIHFARAIGAARSGDTAAARQAVEKLDAIRQALSEVKGEYDWAKQVDIQRMMAQAGWSTHKASTKKLYACFVQPQIWMMPLINIR